MKTEFYFVKDVDGYEDTLEKLRDFEKDYALSSYEFYEGYKKDCFSIDPYRAADWAFECECFELYLGDLKTLDKRDSTS